MVSLDEGCAASHKRVGDGVPKSSLSCPPCFMLLTMAHEGQVTALPASGIPVQGIPEQNHTTKCNLCNCAIKMLILTVTLSEKCSSFICDNHKFHLVALFFQIHRMLSYVLLIIRTYRLSLTYTSCFGPLQHEKYSLVDSLSVIVVQIRPWSSSPSCGSFGHKGKLLRQVLNSISVLSLKVHRATVNKQVFHCV